MITPDKAWSEYPQHEIIEAMNKAEEVTEFSNSGHSAAYEKIIESVIDEIISEKVDDVKQPQHYNIGIDTFERMRANATYEEAMGFIRWNIDKYNTRKKGCDKEDYIKIKAYCNEALWWIENRG